MFYKEGIENKIDKIVEEESFSGVIHLSKDGEHLYNKSFDFADRSNSRENRVSTRFGIASGTKFFTALAIGKLVEQGKLRFDDRALDYVNYDFPTYDPSITIHHLLTHTSGIPDYFDEDEIEDFDNFQIDVPWYSVKEPKDYFSSFPQKPMKFEPGSKFSYSNSGFVLLAAIVAEVTGIPYTAFVEKNVLKPAGMEHSGFFRLDQLPENTANGYVEEEEGWRINIYNLPIIGGGDGGMFTTTGDMENFWNALIKGEIVTTDLVSLFLHPHMQTDPEEADRFYGYGVWLIKTSEYSYVPTIMGCDAGISFLSKASLDNKVIYSCISNTTEGAWPILESVGDLTRL